MKLIGSLLVALAALAFVGCDSETEPTEEFTIQQLFPLKTGNTWVFHANEFDEFGAIDEDYFDTLSVIGPETINGLPGFSMRFPEGDDGFMFYSGNDLVSFESGASRPTILARYPMSLNEDYVLRDTTYEDGSRYRRIMRLVSKNTPVTVDAGSFTAVKFLTLSISIDDGDIDTNSYEESYFAPNIGMVRYEDYGYNWPDTTIKRIQFRAQLSSKKLS